MFGLVFKLGILGYVATSPTLKCDDRIIGGKEIDISKAPHQVSLLFLDNLHCGGSIIDKQLVVTAAHCLFMSPNPKAWTIRVGSTSHAEGGTIHRVAKFVKNPKFSFLLPDSDIAVIWLSDPIQYGDKAKPIPLFDDGEDIKDGEITTVTGWGDTLPGGTSPENLQMVAAPKWNDDECRKAYPNLEITSTMICAGDTQKGPCNGDSGGPLVYNNKLAGVVSWGSRICAEANRPGVFAKVSALRKWLDKTIADLKQENLAEIN